MRKFFLSVLIIAVLGLASWASRENYATRESQKVVHELKADIRKTQAAIRMLQAEWANLNHPDRLAALILVNDAALGLHHITKDHFVNLDSILIPVDPDLPITTPVDVMNRGGMQ